MKGALLIALALTGCKASVPGVQPAIQNRNTTPAAVHSPALPKASAPRIRALIQPSSQPVVGTFIVPANATNATSVDLMSSLDGGRTWRVAMKCGRWTKSSETNTMDWPMTKESELFKLRFNF